MSTRTKNGIRNSIWGLLNKLVVLFGQFAIRTLLVQELGVNYLGLNSLLISLLQLLNLTELGFSNAVIYCMYKPMADRDEVQIRILLQLYRKIYRIVGVSILLLGIIVSPFIKYMLNEDVPDGINIYILYYIYLANTAISYFLFAYKSALITADQRQDIISKVQTSTQAILYLLQIVILVCTNNFYYFVFATIISTILNNIIIQYYSRIKYPHYFCYGEAGKELKDKIRKLVSGIMVQKICQTLRNSIDSVCLSVFTSLAIVAVYGNYYFIITMVVSLCSVVTTAISPVIGNGVAINSKDQNYIEMNNLLFAYAWFSGLVFIALICLYEPFMLLWMGSDYLFPTYMIFAFSLYFYVLSIGDVRALYHSAAGLWWHGKSIWLAEAIANLALNIVLGYYMGALGIVIATILTVLFINFVFGSQVLFKYYFKEMSIYNYFINHGKYFMITCLIGAVTYYVCSFIENTGYLSFVYKLLICLIIPNICYFVVYKKNRHLNYICKILLPTILKR